MTISKLTKGQIMAIAESGVKKILSKPIRIDILLSTLSELLDVSIKTDETPCAIDAHLNDQIIFVEVAQGFNREKINLLRYKIMELIRLYSLVDPRILISMVDIDFRSEDKDKLKNLLNDALSFVKSSDRLRVLTLSRDIKAYMASNLIFGEIKIVKTLEIAMDGLLGSKETSASEQGKTQERIPVSRQKPDGNAFPPGLQKGNADSTFSGASFRIAVVDDDMVVREIIKAVFAAAGWEVVAYANGVDFIEALESKQEFDLLFLDIIMPKINGFAVLEMMHGRNYSIPTIILTALSRKESVMKAREFDVSNYLIKPIKPEGVWAKAVEILDADF